EPAARAAAVLDQHRLAPDLRQLLAEQPRRDVGRSARRERHDEAHGLLRPGLRERRAAEQHGRRHCKELQPPHPIVPGFLILDSTARGRTPAPRRKRAPPPPRRGLFASRATAETRARARAARTPGARRAAPPGPIRRT